MWDRQGRIGEERRGFQISVLLLSQHEALSKWLNLSESQVSCLKLGLSMWCYSEGQDDEHGACCKVAWDGYLSGYSPNIHLAAHSDLYRVPLLHFLEWEHSLARPGLGLRSSSSLLSQALGSGGSGCPLPEGLTAAFWPLPCCVLWGPDRTPAWFRPSSFRWPWTGRPCSQASQLEPHSWQEEVAAIGMRGGASAPLRPSLSAQLFKDPSSAAAAWWLLGNPIPHCHPDPPPPPAPPPLWVLLVPHRRGLLSSEPARPGCPCAGQTGGP